MGYNRRMIAASIAVLAAMLLVAAPAIADNTAPVAFVCSSGEDGFNRMFGLTAINLSSNVPLTLFGNQSPPAFLATSPDGQWLYIVQDSSVSLARYDLRNRTVDRIVRVDMSPRDVAVSPDGRRIYVSCAGYYSNTICVIDAGTFSIVGRYQPGISPERMALSPDGSRIYVLPSSYGHEAPDEIVVLDSSTGDVVHRFLTDPGLTPSGIALTPDGARAYVSFKDSDNYAVINVSSGDMAGSTRTMRSPVDVAASPDGSHAFIASYYYGSSYLEVVDTSAGKISANVDLKAYPGEVQEFPMYSPRVLAGMDGKAVYVVNPDAGTMSVVDVASGRLAATIAVGRLPSDLCLSGDGRTVYVACPGSGSIVTVDTGTNRVTGTIYQSLSPWDVAFSRDGSKVCVASSSTGMLSVIDAVTGTVLHSIDTGVRGLSVVTSPTADLAYLANAGNHSIDVVDIGQGRVINSVGTDLEPTDLAVSPDGSKVYAELQDLDSGTPEGMQAYLGVLNTSSLEIGRLVKLGKYGGSIAASPDGRRVYATRWADNLVMAIDASALSTVAQVSADVSPEDVAVSPDSATVYVADNAGTSLLSIDAATNRIKGRMKLTYHPQHLAISPDGSIACLSGRDGVTVVDLCNGSIIASLPIADARGVAINPEADMGMRSWSNASGEGWSYPGDHSTVSGKQGFPALCMFSVLLVAALMFMVLIAAAAWYWRRKR